MKIKYEDLNGKCKFFEDKEFAEERYNRLNPCKSTEAIFRNTITWAKSFCVPCDQNLSEDFFVGVQRELIEIKNELLDRIAEDLCIEVFTMPPLPYGLGGR
jgi:hypothetical protein